MIKILGKKNLAQIEFEYLKNAFERVNYVWWKF